MPDLVTVSDVELCREGVYDLMSGSTPFTRARLTSAVENAAASARAPRVKISFDEVHAAQSNMPALGNVAGMRLVEDGDVLTIRGDLTGVPKALADILPSAYPTRSIEATAKGDDMTITALELLGVTAPGVHDIEDLVALYDGEVEFAIAAAAPVQIEDAAGETFTVVLASGINVDDVRSAFYDRQRGSSAAFGGPFDDWWVDEIHIQPNELIVRNGQSTYRVPWDVDADGAFTFGDPVEVVVQYVDKVSASAGPVVAYRADVSRPKNDTQEGPTMDLKTLRAEIGLAEDASDEDVFTAAVAELKARPKQDAVTAQVEEAVAAAKAEAETEKAEAIAAAGMPEGFVPISQDLLDDMKTRFARQDEEESIAILAAATKDRAITPAQRDKFATQIKEKPEQRSQVLDFVKGLPTGVVPGGEIGGDAPEEIAAAAADQIDEDAYKAYMKNHHDLEVA